MQKNLNEQSSFKSELKLFKKQFVKTLKILKKNHPDVSKLPCLITISQPEAGKSTYLMKRYPDAETYHIETMTDGSCHWAVSKQALWLEVPGVYMLPRKQPGFVKEFWNTLAEQLQKQTIITPPKTLLIILDIYDILTRSKISNSNHLTQLNSALRYFSDAYKHPINTSLFLNKCDLIPGFNEFFRDRDSDFHKQSWGFGLPHNKETPKLLESALEHEFDLLIKQINKQLLWRLHQENNEKNRSLIKSFPLQIEQLKARISPLLAQYIFTALRTKRITIDSIYLTSCTQVNLLEATDENKKFVNDHEENCLSYFVEEPTTKIEESAKSNTRKSYKLKKTKYYLFSSFCLVILISIAVYLLKEFSASVKYVANTQVMLNELKANNSQQKEVTTLNQATQTLRQLNETIATLSGVTSKLSVRHYIFESNKLLINEAMQYYQQALSQQWLPTLTDTLKNYINDKLDSNPERAYIALTIYLMLGHAQYFDSQYIANHLPMIETLDVSTEELQDIIDQAAISQEQSPITLDETLIAKARQYFDGIQTSELAYIILFANIELHGEINILQQLSAENSLTLPAQDNVIPALYTAKGFAAVNNGSLGDAAQQVIDGNWVLGQPNKQRSISAKTLNKQLYDEYLSEYQKAWSNVVDHLQLKTAKDFTSYSTNLATLASANSPIIKLISLLKENTQPDGLDLANEQLSSLANMLDGLSSPQDSPLFKAFVSLRKINNLVKNIDHSQSPNKQALFALKQLLHHSHGKSSATQQLASTGAQLPSPLNLWMQSLADQGFRLLGHAAGQYVNQAWEEKVRNSYKKLVGSDYPLNRKAKTQINIENFDKFFKKGGILDKFEEMYLLPLLLHNQQGWVVNPLIAPSINIPDIVMEQLQNYANIQAIFFGNKKQAAYVDFTARPEKLDKQIEFISIDDGQTQYVYNHNQTKFETFSWPTSSKKIEVNIGYKNGHVEKELFEGPWAWFSLMKKYGPEKINKSDEEVTLTFGDDHGQGEINFAFGKTPNPFSMSNFQGVWMPFWVFKT
jgi:type VI secretion system protein ImpL